MGNHFIKRLFALAVASALGVSLSFAQGSLYKHKILSHEKLSDYQQYFGKVIKFWKPVNNEERYFDLKKIDFEKEYLIQSIEGKEFDHYGKPNIEMTIAVLEVNAIKAKPIKIKCYSQVYYDEPHMFYFPGYLVEGLEQIKKDWVGKKLSVDGIDCSIIDVILDKDTSLWTNEMGLKFVYSDGRGFTVDEFVQKAMSGRHSTYLSHVEKPADESIRYGETTVVKDEGVTKFSYEDNVMQIIICGTSSFFDFVIKNVSDNSIKIVWNEAVFVGIDGTTSKIMHDGIKYSQKEGDQPASVIIRGAKLSDIAVPTENVHYSSYLSKWVTDSMYPEANEDGKVSLMLPIQIKDVINEYIFEFDIKYEMIRPELHEF